MTTPSVISVSTGVNVGMVSTLTFSHTVAAGTDRFLTVAVTFYNAGGEVVSTVDFNSVAMTLVGVDSRPDVRTELWRLVNPDVGTFDVDIVLDGPLSHASAPLFGAAIDYIDVHQTTPLGTVATADGEDANPTVNVTSGAQELVVDCVGSNIGGGTTQTAGSGQTEQYNPGVQGSGGRRTLPGGSTEPGPGTVTMDWDLDDAGPVSEPWAIVSVSIKPASVAVIPPTVDAGGPYNGDVDTAIALDGTVTPGTDPTPVLLWTIFSGPGGGVFSNDAIEDPTFTPDTVGSYVLQLSADPSDGPAVLDTANLESDDVPPTVDAGGPYNGPSGVATALDATVTPGSDPTPVLLWTIDSGGGGSFSNDAIEDPTFTPDFPTVGPYVLRLTATPSDGPAVFDTANFESDAVSPTVDAGGPYSGDVATPIALNGTVTPGTDPAPTLLWTIDSGGTGTFSDDTVEDPTFTADGIGAYVLRLTVTPSDGSDVFDTAALTTAALADAVFLGGKLLRGGTGDLVTSQLSLGADPPSGDVVFIKGTAHSNSGEMYVAVDDGVIARVFIAGIAHQHNGVRLVTFNTPVVNLNAWGLDANGAQSIAASGAGFPHEGILLRGDGQMVVDGASPVTPPAPPALADLQHWFDMTDQSTQWQNSAGTIPAVNGSDIDRIDNKGFDGQPLIDTLGGRPFYTEDLINGLPGWTDGGGSGQLTTTIINGGSANGISWAGVVRRDVGISAGMFSWNGPVRLLRTDLGGNWEAFVSPPPTVQDTGKLVIDNEWVWVYFSQDSAGDWKLRASGEAQVTGTNSPFSANTGGNSMTLSAGPDGRMAEWLIWDKGLSDSELTDLIDYFDDKYGVLPFGGVLPAQADLIHWFDFSDITTCWEDTAGTIQASNASELRRVDNKGTDGTALNQSTSVVPVYRTPVLNGFGIFEADAAASNLFKLIAAGHSGSTLGSTIWTIFRRRSGASAIFTIFDWFSDYQINMDASENVIVDPSVTVLSPSLVDKWYLVYGSIGVSDDEDYFYATPGPEFNNPVGNRPDIPAGRNMFLGSSSSSAAIIEIVESGFYGRALTSSERAALVNYAVEKYGI